MSNPLRYYTAHIKSDDGILDELELRYGSYFELMIDRDKWFLLNSIGISLCVEAPGQTSNEVIALGARLQTLNASTREAIIKFLIDQLIPPVLPEPSFSYFVIAYALMSEELTKYKVDTTAQDLRHSFFDQGEQKFKQMSPNELEAFLQQNYPE